MKIIKQTTINELVIEKSRFIAHAYQVSNMEEANKIIQEAKKKYWDATHNCSAVVIGENQEFMKSSDDGEPSGTAGVPILETIKKSGITNTLVIVTRYFGGIKLGAGGLVRAYSKATSNVFSIASFIEKRRLKLYELTLSYADSNRVTEYIKENTHFIDISYAENIKLTFATNEIDDLKLIIQNTLNKEIYIKYIDEITVDYDLS